MKKIIKSFCLLLFAFFSCTYTMAEESWIDLFNGKDLKGWSQINGNAPFVVENGTIVGTSVKNTPNSFLKTDSMFTDFILEFEVIIDTTLNSGVQFRSNTDQSYLNGRVFGYQAEIDPSNRAWSGGIYDEARRGWIYPLSENPSGMKAFKNGEWNHYRIEAFGQMIRIYINGINTSNLLDDISEKGFIALQVHSIPNYKPWLEGKKVTWKNIRIQTSEIGKKLIQNTNFAPEVNLISNTLTEAEKAQGWSLLFDGKTSNGWRGAHKETFPEKGWKIENGVLTVLKSTGGESTGGGDIVTMQDYSAFELKLEFKITEGANSGIKYFVTEKESQKGSAFGLEYQILDNAKHPDAKQFTTFEGSRTLGSLYDLIPANSKRFNGIGQWNRVKIVVYPNNKVEHWLNGFRLIEYERKSPEFKERVSKSKYAAPNYNTNGAFGEADQGKILLQDHGDEVSFKSIKIKVLKNN